MELHLTWHACQRMAERGIARSDVEDAVEHWIVRRPGENGCSVLETNRVHVVIGRRPNDVVTVGWVRGAGAPTGTTEGSLR